MALSNLFKKKNAKTKMCNTQDFDFSTDEYLEDITLIEDIKHMQFDLWHQYDVSLATDCYGWEQMIDWADYMSASDLEHITQVTTGSLGSQEEDITESYHKSDGKCAETQELKSEMGVLSIAGISKVLGMPMKIVWFNQTRILRFFTLIDNELLIKKYAETVMRRSFGTENAMKLGKTDNR